MKKNILLLILVSITMEVFAQDTTIVFVNNKKVAQSISKDKQDGIILLMKKSICKNYKSLAIQVKSEYVNRSVYKKELEVTGDNTVIISETNSRAGYFTPSGWRCHQRTRRYIFTGSSHRHGKSDRANCDSVWPK